MTGNGWIQHVEDDAPASEEQLDDRAEQTVESVSDDGGEQADGLTDEVKATLLEFKSRLQEAIDGHDRNLGPSGRH